MIDLLIADESRKFTEITSKKLEGMDLMTSVTHISTASDIKKVLKDHPISVMLLGPSWGKSKALGQVTEVFDAFPNVATILIADSLSTELLREAMRAGVKDVLPRTVEAKELKEALIRADQISRSMEKLMSNESIARKAKQNDITKNSKTVIMLGVKGGTGKSFIATNLAVCLAREKNYKVALLDLDLLYGDISLMLHLVPKRTFYDVLEDIERLDTDMMKGFLTRHESGVAVLASPLEPSLGQRVTPENIRHVIRALQGMMDYVIIDTPASVDDRILAALQESDEAFVVTSMDIPSIKAAKQTLQLINGNGQGPGAKDIHLLVNRSDSRVGLDPDHLVSALKSEIYAEIPSCRQVPLSMNKGIPIIDEFPRSPATRSLRHLADLVEPPESRNDEITDGGESR